MKNFTTPILCSGAVVLVVKAFVAIRDGD